MKSQYTTVSSLMRYFLADKAQAQPLGNNDPVSCKASHKFTRELVGLHAVLSPPLSARNQQEHIS